MPIVDSLVGLDWVIAYAFTLFRTRPTNQLHFSSLVLWITREGIDRVMIPCAVPDTTSPRTKAASTAFQARRRSSPPLLILICHLKPSHHHHANQLTTVTPRLQLSLPLPPENWSGIMQMQGCWQGDRCSGRRSLGSASMMVMFPCRLPGQKCMCVF